MDWFVIELIEGRPYRFNLEGGEEGALADPDAHALRLRTAHQVASDDDGGRGLNAYLTFASPTGGTYFAAVSRPMATTGTGRY